MEGRVDKQLTQEQVEEVVEEQIKSAMNWEFFIVVGILLLPMFILDVGGIYENIPTLLKLGMWLVLYITYYKCQEWAVARKVRHTIKGMRNAA